MQQTADVVDAQLPCLDLAANSSRVLRTDYAACVWDRQAPGARGGYGIAKCGQQLFVFGGVVSIFIATR